MRAIAAVEDIGGYPALRGVDRTGDVGQRGAGGNGDRSRSVSRVFAESAARDRAEAQGQTPRADDRGRGGERRAFDHLRCSQCGHLERIGPAAPLTAPLLTLATALLAICGWTERSPLRTRSPTALTSWANWPFSVAAADSWRSTVSERLVLRSIRAANCAVARLWASAVMSIPLPAPSEEIIELVTEVVGMDRRTARRRLD